MGKKNLIEFDSHENIDNENSKKENLRKIFKITRVNIT